MTKNMFDMQHMTACDTSLNWQLAQRFMADTSGDILAESVTLAISKKTQFLDIVALIKGDLSEARAVSLMENREGHREMVIYGNNGACPVLMFLTVEEHAVVNEIKLTIMSNPDATLELRLKFFADFEQEKMGIIKWWFTGRSGVDSRDIYLPTLKTTIHPEFYPDMDNPAKYMADYMASDASIMLVAGPAGTGKTTLLRHLISDYKLIAHVIYDEVLMQKDSIFQDFLFDDHGDIMIIEDADTILGDREKEGNKLMSRFLNVSDGLIKLPNKKVVFTTNLSDFGKVDSALIRPGRCFGVLETRNLDLSEAQAAAKVAGLPIPIEKRSYTIAELFNRNNQPRVRNIGFGARH